MLIPNRSINRPNICQSGSGSSRLLQPSFLATFPDAGAGIVTTTAARGGAAATFTRATTALTQLITGLWASVASGQSRSYYSAGTYLGYLAEGARTNLTIFSDDFTNAAWVKTTMTAAKTATGPDGVVNSASTLTATAGNATALQAITDASASRIASMFIKRRTGSGVVNITQDNGTTWTAITVTAGWTQVSSTNQTLANPTVGVRIVTNADAVDVAYFMNEVATFASTPIPTTVAAVTRNADVLTYAFAPNQAAGTLFASYQTSNIGAGNKYVFGFADGTNNELVGVYTTTANAQGIVIDGGVTQANIFGATAVANTTVKSALAYAVNDFAISSNGGTVATDATGTLPTTTTTYIGNDGTGGQQNFGPISRIAYYPRRLPDSMLVSITS